MARFPPGNTGTFTFPTDAIPKPPPKKPKPPKTAPFGWLTFRGVGAHGGQHNPDTFTALCGSKRPTITGGYAIWQSIPRPLWRSITVFTGYEPVQMEVNVMFGVWTGAQGWHKGNQITSTDDSDAGHQVERDIGVLEWMAGSNFVAGPSPFVYANSFAPNGHTTPLIPFQYQQTSDIGWPAMKDTRTWPWIINGGIEWGESISNKWGFRIRQEAKFTLTNYQGFGGPSHRTVRGGWFVATRQRWNALLIAEAPTSHALSKEQLAKEIIHAPRNKHLHLKAIKQRIKPGKRVWVPAHPS